MLQIFRLTGFGPVQPLAVRDGLGPDLAALASDAAMLGIVTGNELSPLFDHGDAIAFSEWCAPPDQFDNPPYLIINKVGEKEFRDSWSSDVSQVARILAVRRNRYDAGNVGMMPLEKWNRLLGVAPPIWAPLAIVCLAILACYLFLPALSLAERILTIELPSLVGWTPAK